MIENPILRGFCPDPSILRVEDDYYIACSTFEWWPGVKLFHSCDLAHWRQLPSPLRRMNQLDMRGAPLNGGVWAPCLSYSDGVFFLIFTDVKTQLRPYYNTHNYVAWTDDITGDWSDPVYLNSTGFDPSLFHDDDGRKYLLVMRNGFKGILLQEYDHATRSLVGPVHHIFGNTALGFTEGPHLYKRAGWYYLVLAEGGTGYGHAVTVVRSRNLLGPYEVDPQNPMLTSRDNPAAALQKAGHASLVETQHGEWVMAHLCARPVLGKSLTGRETALQPIEWIDDWPRLRGGGHNPLERFALLHPLPDHPMDRVPARDEFDDPLGTHYSSLRVPLGDDATVENGELRLAGRESLVSHFRVSLLARRQEESSCRAETAMCFAPQLSEHAAGLAHIYNNGNFLLALKTLTDEGIEVLRLWRAKRAANWELLDEATLPPHTTIVLRAENRGIAARFFYALDGGDYTPLGGEIDSGFLSDEDAPGFTGAHFALYCHDLTGQGYPAHFSHFDLRPI